MGGWAGRNSSGRAAPMVAPLSSPLRVAAARVLAAGSRCGAFWSSVSSLAASLYSATACSGATADGSAAGAAAAVAPKRGEALDLKGKYETSSQREQDQTAHGSDSGGDGGAVVLGGDSTRNGSGAIGGSAVARRGHPTRGWGRIGAATDATRSIGRWCSREEDEGRLGDGERKLLLSQRRRVSGGAWSPWRAVHGRYSFLMAVELRAGAASVRVQRAATAAAANDAADRRRPCCDQKRRFAITKPALIVQVNRSNEHTTSPWETHAAAPPPP